MDGYCHIHTTQYISRVLSFQFYSRWLAITHLECEIYYYKCMWISVVIYVAYRYVVVYKYQHTYLYVHIKLFLFYVLCIYTHVFLHSYIIYRYETIHVTFSICERTLPLNLGVSLCLEWKVCAQEAPFKKCVVDVKHNEGWGKFSEVYLRHSCWLQRQQ